MDISDLRIERVVPQPVERLFAAWSQPERFARWAWGSLGADVRAEIDFRVGGRYRAATRRPNGEEWAFGGIYTAIDPGRRLAYTVRWEAPMGYESGREEVRIDFEADGARTRILFTHTGVPDAASRDRHRRGWEDCLAALEATLQAA